MSRRPIDSPSDAQADVQADVQAVGAPRGAAPWRPVSASDWPMTGRDGGPVRELDRPIPFFLTDAPVPFTCSDFEPVRRGSAAP